MKRPIIFVLFASILVACRSAGPAVPTGAPATTPDSVSTQEAILDGQLVKADSPRLESPQVSNQALQALVQGDTAFAFDLYQRVTQESEDNLIYSPYSISLAFSMLYAGARGETEAQMMQALHYLSQDEQHLTFNALDQRISGLGGKPSGEIEGEPFELNVANALWGQEDFPFEPPYLDLLAQHYGAGLRIVNFARDPETARQMINRWVADETRDRIENIMPPGVIDSSTRLVLANAIYFNASWLFPFDQSATREMPFTLLDGSPVDVAMMHLNTARVPYLQGEGYQAVWLPYAGQQVDMLVILPGEGQFETVQAGLTADFLDQLRSQAELHDVTLSMPKFDFESDLNLPDHLSAMGMTDAFILGQADFSGIAAGRELFVSAALHKGSITVDELGTEAAAATVIAMAESAMPRADLAIDRPFIFAILERDTGTLLFLGRVLNPET